MALITLTHALGCDGLEIARRTADRLNVEVYDDARLKQEALRMGLHPEELKGFDEKAPEWFERLWSDAPGVYLHVMESVVYEAARIGEGVIIGHGSQVLLRDFGCALHVLVVSSEESRIRSEMRRRDVSRESAQRLIQKDDRQKNGFFKYAFRKAWDDPTLYDLCVNPDKIGTEQAARLIVETVQSPQMRACSLYALDALQRLSQTKRIEALYVSPQVHFIC